MLSISNSNKKNKTLKYFSNTLREYNKNQNLWEGEGVAFFRDYIYSFLCIKYLFDIQVDNRTSIFFFLFFYKSEQQKYLKNKKEKRR